MAPDASGDRDMVKKGPKKVKAKAKDGAVVTRGRPCPQRKRSPAAVPAKRMTAMARRG